MTKKQPMKVVRATGTKLLTEEIDSLPVDLSKDELLSRGTSLVRLRDEERKVEAEFDTHKEAHKKALSAIFGQREFLEQAIRDKREPRPVKVQGWAHYDAGQYRVIRTDTGELLHERPLVAAELQEEIQFDGDTP